MPITVLLVDDDQEFRSALRALLRVQPGLLVVEEAAEGANAVRMAVDLRPDVAVVDCVLPDIDGLEVVRRIKAACPHTACVMLSGFSDAEFRVAALEAGATALLGKQNACEGLVATLRHVAAVRGCGGEGRAR